MATDTLPLALRLAHDGDDVIVYGQVWRVDQPSFDGSVFIHVLVTQAVRIEIENANPHQNPFVAFDVDRDGEVEPINTFSRASGSLGVELPVPATDPPCGFNIGTPAGMGSSHCST